MNNEALLIRCLKVNASCVLELSDMLHIETPLTEALKFFLLECTILGRYVEKNISDTFILHDGENEYLFKFYKEGYHEQ